MRQQAEGGERRAGEGSGGLGRGLGLVAREQSREIEWPRVHLDASILAARPFVFRTIAVQLDAVAVRIPQVDPLANAMIGRAFELDAMLEDSTHRGRKGFTVRQEDREVVETRRALGWARGATARPGIQADVMVIAAGRQKDRFAPVVRGHLEAEDVAIEGEGAVEIADREVHVADASAWINNHLNSKTR